MCEGLEAADGKSSAKQLTLISPKEPEASGEGKNLSEFKDINLLAFTGYYFPLNV